MIIISLGVLTIQECKAPRPAPHTQDTARAPFPSFYCCNPTLCHSQPSPSGFPRTEVHPPPRFHGKIWLNKAQVSSRVGRLDTWKLRLQAFPGTLSARPWPRALSHRPISVWPV